jgi:hypothetical protein
MLLERERIEADPYGQLAPSPPSHPDGATNVAAAAASVADSRAPQGYSPNHARNSSHPPHSHVHSAAVRSKRPGGPPFSHHSHSHSHPPRAPPPTITFSPPASAPAGRTVAPSLSRNHHSSRGAAAAAGAGAGKGSIARRKSSPPPHHAPAEKSALSLNAPPFEPASIKGKHHSRGAGGP